MGEQNEWISIGNEFTIIKVRKEHTRNGERLQIVSPRLGYAISVDALELESLTWQDETLFSGLLETPYGPDDEKTEGKPLSELFKSDNSDSNTT